MLMILPVGESTSGAIQEAEIDIIDALVIAQYYVGLITEFTCNENDKT